MKCVYCQSDVLSAEPITVSGIGPAHRHCYEKSLVEQRVFRHLNLRALPDADLRELMDMAKMELNVREADVQSVDLWQEDVLFC
ncbi:hypothetical protein [Bacterioplanoides sp.]|uniref:hypothetical protein n=1 Tax=Bacterioplanoides sp. TaxID=2066072 RepID=UPI003B003AC7